MIPEEANHSPLVLELWNIDIQIHPVNAFYFLCHMLA